MAPLFDPKPVIQEMLTALPTLWLAATALLFTLIIALPLAYGGVAKPHSLIDKSIRLIVFVLTAILIIG